MKLLRLLLLPVLLVGMAASNPAWAHGQHHFGRHAGFGVFVAAPLFYPWYAWPYPSYTPSPPVYVEQGDALSAPSGYWYRCDNPSGYYPDVKECPAGWHKVVPTPPAN